MAVVIATATCTAFRAVEEATGEVASARVLAERVGFLAALTRAMSSSVVAAHWNDSDLGKVGSGVGPDGRALPAKGWMALRRLGWQATTPEGVYVSDRVRRVAEEAAARTLRLAAHRRTVVKAVLATWPADPLRRTDADWSALQRKVSAPLAVAEIRNRTRQLHAWQADHGGTLPACLTELEQPPTMPAQALLAAADKQLVRVDRSLPETAVLRVQLPLAARPAMRGDWAWHAIGFRLPGYVPADADLCLPTLWVSNGRVRVDLPWRCTSSSVPRDGHAVALGLDWGVNTLLTGTVGKLADTRSGRRVVTDGRRLRFDATGIAAKLHRLRSNREQIAARRDHHARLLGGLPEDAPGRGALLAKHAVLQVEHQRICARIRGLNHTLAWAAARWAVDQAQALGATIICVEDLATLEARGRRRGNARLSGQVRGRVVGAIRHLAAKEGIATVTVPARGTSKLCPRCGKTLQHVPAPDRAGERGWKWANCPSCGLAGDRDHAAAERIVARGLLAQALMDTDPKTGRHSITTSVDGNVARARRSKRRTRAAPRADRAPAAPPSRRRLAGKPARQPSRRVPDRRAVPAPAAQPAGKRPAGQAPQTYPHRQVGAGSGPARDRLVRPGRHRRPDTEWGFHRNVTATVVLPLGDYGPAAAWPRPPGRPGQHG